jgi:peroxiredoxin Q/BCP
MSVFAVLGRLDLQTREETHLMKGRKQGLTRTTTSKSIAARAKTASAKRGAAKRQTTKSTAPRKPAARPARGVPAASGGGPGEGDRAPVFRLATGDGRTIALSDYAGKRVVLYFYPKDMTSGCTTEACAFRDAYARFKAAGAEILGVSRDSEATHAKFRDKYALPFPLLADVDGKISTAYGVWKEKSLYGRKFMGIERSTFVIGPDGRIVRAWRKVKVNDHDQEVLAALEG